MLPWRRSAVRGSIWVSCTMLAADLGQALVMTVGAAGALWCAVAFAFHRSIASACVMSPSIH